MEPVDLRTALEGVSRGAFIDVQRAAGAAFYESSSGRLWTKGFGDPVAEYWAVRRRTGLWDVSSLAKYHFVGREVLSALDRLTTRAMLDARPGAVRYAMILNEGGRLLDEGTTLVVSAEEAYFLGNDGSESFLAHLVEHTPDLDVRIENVTEQISNISVQGPGSLNVMASLTDADLAGLRWFGLLPEPIHIAGVRGVVVRAGYTGERGYEFYLLDGPEGAERLWDSLIQCGATPVGFDAIDMLRVEAGLVMCRREYTPGVTNPYDLSFDRFVDLGHAFIGRDRCLASAHAPPRRLVTLAFESANLPDRGSQILDREGQDAGTVTSAVTTPGYGPLGLAIVSVGCSAEATRLSIDGQPATVRSLPIRDPGKELLRG